MNKYRTPYTPDLHEQHGRPWSREDLIYLCSMYGSTKKADLALALGRTHAATMAQVYVLRKKGEFEYYKQLGRR
jgi:hypothetical protein